MRHTLAILTAALACVLAAASHAGEGPSAIVLRSTVLVAPGQAVTLADVAALRGAEAERLGPTPVDLAELSADPAGWRKIDAQALRPILEQADANWGLLELRGGPCYVRTSAIDPKDPGAGNGAGAHGPAAAGTVRDLAERWIAHRFKVSRRDAEIRWTSASEGLLDRAAADLTPYFDDAGLSDRMRLEIVLYDAEAHAVARGRAEAHVRLRREVAVLTRDVRARQMVTQRDVRMERRWIDAGSTPAAADAVVDREAAANLKAGAVVKASDVRATVAIERGERAQVRVITPTITVTMLARARADGRPGQIIEFEKIAPTRADRLRFNARVDGPGSAVMVSGSTNR